MNGRMYFAAASVEELKRIIERSDLVDSEVRVTPELWRVIDEDTTHHLFYKVISHGGRFAIGAMPQEPRVINWKYWKCGSNGAVAIVAKLGTVGDWAAYIGCSQQTESEERTVVTVVNEGCKLYVTEAKQLFGDIANPYRE